LDDGGRASEQARSQLREVEGQDPAQIDVLVSDWRDTLQHLVRILARDLVDSELQPVRVPGHDNVGEQGQGSGDRAELLHRAPMLSGDYAVVDGALEAVNGFALVEEVEDCEAEQRIAEVVA
jgi:hypothetical protein